MVLRIPRIPTRVPLTGSFLLCTKMRNACNEKIPSLTSLMSFTMDELSVKSP